MTKDDLKLANKVSIRTMVLNFILTAVQIVIGILAGSAALVSSAIHTLSDGATTIIVIIGVNLAGKKSDKSHQYGHERFESIASLIMAVVLAIVGIGIGYSAVHDIIVHTRGGEYEPMSMEVAALIIAGLTIAAKEWMFWYTRAAAKKTGSGALMADAWHSRSDAMATVGAFFGILGAKMGFPVLDSVAGIIICAFIVKTAFDIFRDATNQMVDKACAPEVLEKLETVISEQDGVLGIDLLKTRMFGSKMYVDIEIAANGTLTLNESHRIAEAVHDAVEAAFCEVKHCMVHVNPAG
jgi:cation diffusion facilitator family transporter